MFANRLNFIGSLRAWYAVNARDLPWRTGPGAADQVTDPYRVWLSEIMLQQTTVAHAGAYFLKFVERWPVVAALAAANDADVMGAWAGLGYYSRARNLLACARAVERDHAGVFPLHEAELLKLPGIGPYTAAAIAAIAFGQRANVVDGNVERVMARVAALDVPMPDAKPRLRDIAAGFLPDSGYGDWAQALMDLGATVCRPRSPLCGQCPVAGHCQARQDGNPEVYPLKAPKAVRPKRTGIVWVVLDRDGNVEVETRPTKGLLGGMLGLPTLGWDTRASPSGEAKSLMPNKPAGRIRHVFTHFELELEVRLSRIGELHPPASRLAAADLDQLPSLFRKAVDLALANVSGRA